MAKKAAKKTRTKKVKYHTLINPATGETQKLTQTQFKEQHQQLEAEGWKIQGEESEVPPTGSNPEQPQDPTEPPVGEVEPEDEE